MDNTAQEIDETFRAQLQIAYTTLPERIFFREIITLTIVDQTGKVWLGCLDTVIYVLNFIFSPIILMCSPGSLEYPSSLKNWESGEFRIAVSVDTTIWSVY